MLLELGSLTILDAATKAWLSKTINVSRLVCSIRELSILKTFQYEIRNSSLRVLVSGRRLIQICSEKNWQNNIYDVSPRQKYIIQQNFIPKIHVATRWILSIRFVSCPLVHSTPKTFLAWRKLEGGTGSKLGETVRQKLIFSRSWRLSLRSNVTVERHHRPLLLFSLSFFFHPSMAWRCARENQPRVAIKQSVFSRHSPRCNPRCNQTRADLCV